MSLLSFYVLSRLLFDVDTILCLSFASSIFLLFRSNTDEMNIRRNIIAFETYFYRTFNMLTFVDCSNRLPQIEMKIFFALGCKNLSFLYVKQKHAFSMSDKTVPFV